MLSIRKTLLIALLPVMFQACAVQQHEVNALAEQLDDSTPEAILLSLQSIDPPKRDRGQYLLNTGLLKSITGDFEGAIHDLQSAKKILNKLQAISVSENLAAATINETLRSYDASPSERVLLHVLLSIDYLMQNDLDAARVEVLQADVVMNELAREEVPIGQLASAHYIAGLVYELGGELDDARISYRGLKKCAQDHSQVILALVLESVDQIASHCVCFEGSDRKIEGIGAAGTVAAGKAGGGDIAGKRFAVTGANSGIGISLGFGCTVGAGVYITAGAKVSLYNEANEAINLAGEVVAEGANIAKGTDISGRDKMLIFQDSITGKLICKPNPKTVELNAALHVNA